LADGGKVGRIYTLSSDYKILIDRDELVVYKDFSNNFYFNIKPEERYCLLDGKIEFESRIIDNPEGGFPGRDEYWDELIDYDKIDKGFLVLRTWREGDKFIPLGMDKDKKISDFFTDEKVAGHIKKGIPILVSGGEIIWICGYRISDKVKITKRTRRILCLKCIFI
ncbi:tRNA lysidine(34) synthetase TilS, partial [candidate division KSB1 bacterium]